MLSDRHTRACDGSASAAYADATAAPLPVACAGAAREVACSARAGGVITTGGGFSDVYARPAWQAAAVARYLAAADAAAALSLIHI